MADTSDPGSGLAALPWDKEKWLQTDLWDLEEAAWLLIGVDPECGWLLSQDSPEHFAQIDATERLLRACRVGAIGRFEQSSQLWSVDVIRWANRGNAWPKFPFRLDELEALDAQPESGNGNWPWGSHETELLRHLAAAANRCWVNYDPSDPSTAPTNAQVAEFLKGRGVSTSMADKMATILRADGLPPGPR